MFPSTYDINGIVSTHVEKTELLPHHAAGASKARAMGWTAEEFEVPPAQEMARFRSIIEEG